MTPPKTYCRPPSHKAISSLSPGIFSSLGPFSGSGPGDFAEPFYQGPACDGDCCFTYVALGSPFGGAIVMLQGPSLARCTKKGPASAAPLSVGMVDGPVLQALSCQDLSGLPTDEFSYAAASLGNVKLESRPRHTLPYTAPSQNQAQMGLKGSLRRPGSPDTETKDSQLPPLFSSSAMAWGCLLRLRDARSGLAFLVL